MSRCFRLAVKDLPVEDRTSLIEQRSTLYQRPAKLPKNSKYQRGMDGWL
jgi:hypothetical protein